MIILLLLAYGSFADYPLAQYAVYADQDNQVYINQNTMVSFEYNVGAFWVLVIANVGSGTNCGGWHNFQLTFATSSYYNGLPITNSPPNFYAGGKYFFSIFWDVPAYCVQTASWGTYYQVQFQYLVGNNHQFYQYTSYKKRGNETEIETVPAATHNGTSPVIGVSKFKRGLWTMGTGSVRQGTPTCPTCPILSGTSTDYTMYTNFNDAFGQKSYGQPATSTANAWACT